MGVISGIKDYLSDRGHKALTWMWGITISIFSFLGVTGGALATDMSSVTDTVMEMLPVIIVLMVFSMIIGMFGGLKMGK